MTNSVHSMFRVLLIGWAISASTAFGQGVQATREPSSPTRDTLEDIVRVAGRSAEVVLPDANERMTVRQLFGQTFDLTGKEPEIETLRSGWAKWRMELAPLRLPGGESVWLVRETDTTRRGRGIYVFRTKTNSRLVLQAPHGRHDLHTRKIVAGMFVEGDARAAAFNTAHRRELDVAHREGTYFQAFTAATARAVARATIVQIHGFDSRKHRGIAASRSVMIVSNATTTPGPWFGAAAARLAEQLPSLKILVYPYDVRELGGTTNVQAKFLRNARNPGFLHLECNRYLRDRLRQDRSVRKGLLLALGQWKSKEKDGTVSGQSCRHGAIVDGIVPAAANGCAELCANNHRADRMPRPPELVSF